MEGNVRLQTVGPAMVGLAALVAMGSPGCGGGDADSSTGITATSSSGTGAGGEGGQGGAGGQGGGTAESGKSATETVSAGESSTSPNYKMVFTFGQPTQNQGKTTSPSYRLQGGLSGANGAVPQ
jgi:hypothetical protein